MHSFQINDRLIINLELFVCQAFFLQADMITQKLGVEPGAVFTGHCQMTEKANHEPKATITKTEAPTE